MKILKINRKVKGKFLFKKRIIKFRLNNELIGDSDLINLFLGFLKLIEKSKEMKIEEKYLKRIRNLENEIKLLKRYN